MDVPGILPVPDGYSAQTSPTVAGFVWWRNVPGEDPGPANNSSVGEEGSVRFHSLLRRAEKTLASDLAGNWESVPPHLQRGPLSRERSHWASARMETPEEVKRLFQGQRGESHCASPSPNLSWGLESKEQGVCVSERKNTDRHRHESTGGGYSSKRDDQLSQLPATVLILKPKCWAAHMLGSPLVLGKQRWRVGNPSPKEP